MSEKSVFVVLGLDADGKPHASKFTEAEVELASKAAELMGFHGIRVTDVELIKSAESLPAGRIFAAGKAFVPFVKRETFNVLAKLVPVEIKPSRTAAAIDPEPASEQLIPQRDPWAEIRVGNIVLGTRPRDEEGWWEAVVIAISSDDQLTLRYRDYPEEGRFKMERRKVGLMPS